MSDDQYQARFDALVTLSNGGRLSVEDFQVDVPGAHPDEQDVAARLLASLGLLPAERVKLRNLRVCRERHPRGPGRRSERSPDQAAPQRLWEWIELSHVIVDGMVTYPGLPVPRVFAHLTREASRQIYAAGTEFTIDQVTMVGNTGTYLDSPYHRYPEGADLAGLPLSKLVDLPTVVVASVGSGSRAVDVGAFASCDVGGRAVLIHTGSDERWGTPAYAQNAPYLTEAGARWLVEHGARLVGIDAINIDDAEPRSDGRRPAHSLLLAAEISVVENLTALGQLPAIGARFTAAPPLFSGVGTFPVRAYAAIPAR